MGINDVSWFPTGISHQSVVEYRQQYLRGAAAAGAETGAHALEKDMGTHSSHKPGGSEGGSTHHQTSTGPTSSSIESPMHNRGSNHRPPEWGMTAENTVLERMENLQTQLASLMSGNMHPRKMSVLDDGVPANGPMSAESQPFKESALMVSTQEATELPVGTTERLLELMQALENKVDTLSRRVARIGARSKRDKKGTGNLQDPSSELSDVPELSTDHPSAHGKKIAGPKMSAALPGVLPTVDTSKRPKTAGAVSAVGTTTLILSQPIDAPIKGTAASLPSLQRAVSAKEFPPPSEILSPSAMARKQLEVNASSDEDSDNEI